MAKDKGKDLWPKTIDDIEVPEVITEYSKLGLTRMQIEVLKVRTLEKIAVSLEELIKLTKKGK